MGSNRQQFSEAAGESNRVGRRGWERPWSMPAVYTSICMLAAGFFSGFMFATYDHDWGMIGPQMSIFVAPPSPDTSANLASRPLTRSRSSSEDEDLSSDTEQAALEALVADVKRYADPNYLAKCLDIIQGGGCSYMSQVSQDWVLFHNFFKHKRWGQGFYVDLGSNDAIEDSNTVFFDKCLGWKGVCVEPNPRYHPGYANRTCQLFKNCVYSHEKDLFLTDDGQTGRLVAPDGGGQHSVISVKCRPLESILDEAKVPAVDFVSLDVEGEEVNVLQCFNFDKYDINAWTVETNKQNKYFDFLMNRAGFDQVWKVLGSMEGCGVELDTVYARTKKKKVHCPHPKNLRNRVCGSEQGVQCSQPGLPLSA